ncbi:MAG: AEC family transporter [Clostridiales bacterium]|nr:AEC family transporter [Clostridiales bacterium]
MKENLLIALEVVLPLFFCMALGYGLRGIRLVDEPSLKVMNKLCFKVFLPILLFRNIYTTDLKEAFDVKLIGFSLAALLIWFLVLLLIVPRIEKENPRRGVLIQGMFRSNYALFGLPVATTLCGEGNIGATSLLLGIVIPFYNVLAVITLEIFRGGKPDLKKILLGIIKNPLIIASVLGIIFYALKIQLPKPVDKTVLDLSRVATPLSLVVLGGYFTFSSIAAYRKQLALGVIGKLVVCPLVVLPFAAAMGFRSEAMVALMIMFGAPIAVSSFTMAQEMDGDGDLAAQLVIFSTFFSILTIFLLVFILKTLQLL